MTMIKARKAGPISHAVARIPIRTSTAAPAPSSMTSARGMPGQRGCTVSDGSGDDAEVGDPSAGGA